MPRTTMGLANAEVRRHTALSGGYRQMDLHAPTIAATALPGQFVHLRIPGLEVSALRRPFSIYRAEEDSLSLLYKPVGRGTELMTRIEPGAILSLLGPLGNGFPLPEADAGGPVLVAGGYGVAPLYFLATRLPVTGVLMVGGRTTADILCDDDFRALGWTVQIATEDGSRGTRGRVTDLLDAWLSQHPPPAHPPSTIFVCGPDGLLQAISERARRDHLTAWISLDRHMGCAVGVCLACVQSRIRTDGTIERARVCRDGPVFDAREILWDGSGHDT